MTNILFLFYIDGAIKCQTWLKQSSYCVVLSLLAGSEKLNRQEPQNEDVSETVWNMFAI